VEVREEDYTSLFRVTDSGLFEVIGFDKSVKNY